MAWNDFSTAETQNNSFDLIPAKTPAKVHMKIRPGGYNDPSHGWDGGYATQADSGAVYLNCEFTIIGGRYGKRKVFSLIGLSSPKGPTWGNMGRSFIRAALESAAGVRADDTSEKALKARRINGIGDLDGIQFCAFIDQDKPQAGYDAKNIIQNVLGVDHKDYAALMSEAAPVGASAPTQTAAPKAAASAGKPSWLD